jgi:hypothetical protein
MNEIFIDISSDKNKVVSKQEIIGLLRKKSDLTGDILFRRARTMASWFKWIQSNLGIEVDRNRNIRISRQLSLV